MNKSNQDGSALTTTCRQQASARRPRCVPGESGPSRTRAGRCRTLPRILEKYITLIAKRSRQLHLVPDSQDCRLQSSKAPSGSLKSSCSNRHRNSIAHLYHLCKILTRLENAQYCRLLWTLSLCNLHANDYLMKMLLVWGPHLSGHHEALVELVA